jgi:hypothetical protein
MLTQKGKPCREVVVGVADGEETAHAQTLAEEHSTWRERRWVRTAKITGRYNPANY